jgi:murein DD-endopeptidase MepM/ murein hydrolase activator NlpD
MKQYVYPFPSSIECKIVKPTGKYAHENFKESKYAIDFSLPLGTEVLVAREGIVVLTKQDSNESFTPLELSDLTLSEIEKIAIKSTNYILIKHFDGTLAGYSHLDQRKIVKEGDKVSQGETIAYTGKSGIMDCYVLEFNVLKIKGKKVISIPTNIMEGVFSL